MDRHCENAMQVAHYLQKHADVAAVNYCGLETHPDHAVALKQMSKAGGMLSFETEGWV